MLPAHARLLHDIEAHPVHVSQCDSCQCCNAQLHECHQLCSEGRDNARLIGGPHWQNEAVRLGRIWAVQEQASPCACTQSGHVCVMSSSQLASTSPATCMPSAPVQQHCQACTAKLLHAQRFALSSCSLLLSGCTTTETLYGLLTQLKRPVAEGRHPCEQVQGRWCACSHRQQALQGSCTEAHRGAPASCQVASSSQVHSIAASIFAGMPDS